MRETNRQLADECTDAGAGGGGTGGVGTKSIPSWAWARRRRPEVPAELKALLEQRQAARKAKDFKRADAIRDELKAKGWIIEDTPKGARLKRL